MSRILEERAYWNKAALSPNVERDYLSDFGVDECLAQILPELETQPALDIVADIGCGIGRLTVPLANKFKRTRFYGLDTAVNMLLRATAHPHVKYKISDARQLRLPDGHVDAAVCTFVIQHLPPDGVQKLFAQLGRILRIGGVLRFQYVEGTEHDGPYSHHYTEDEIDDWLGQNRLSVRRRDLGLHESWRWVTAVKL